MTQVRNFPLIECWSFDETNYIRILLGLILSFTQAKNVSGNEYGECLYETSYIQGRLLSFQGRH